MVTVVLRRKRVGKTSGRRASPRGGGALEIGPKSQGVAPHCRLSLLPQQLQLPVIRGLEPLTVPQGSPTHSS